MKNRSIVTGIIFVAAILVVIIVRDVLSGRPEKRKANPYEFSVEEYKKVDPALIKYKEIRQIRTNFEREQAIGCLGNIIYLLGDSFLQVINESGKQLLKKTLSDEPACICVLADKTIAVGFRNYLELLDSLGSTLNRSERQAERSIFTAIAAKGDTLYVADAGARLVRVYNTLLEYKGEFEGISGSSVLHGFIIPSPYFDLAVNFANELWVVNPGMHSLQNYSADGSLIDYWGNTSIGIEGFSGCCNPAHIAFSPGGDFVTSEKGLVRIKIYDNSGNMLAVVAPPAKFTDDGKAPDIATDDKGNIIALDFDKKMVRIFTPID